MPKRVPATEVAGPAPQSPSSPNTRDRERQPSATVAGIPNAARPAVDIALAALAQQLGVATETIEVIGVRRQYRPAGASDSPGRADGWQILLAAGDTRYGYRVDAQGKLSRIAPSE